MCAMSLHITVYNLPYIFWYTLQSPQSNVDIVFLFPIFATVFTSLQFFICLRLFTICDVYIDSVTNISYTSLLIYFFSHVRISYLEKYLRGLYIQKYLLFPLSSSSFLSSRNLFCCGPSWDSIFILSHTSSCAFCSMMCPYLLQHVQYLFYFILVLFILLWPYVPHLLFIPFNWCTYNAFYGSFSYFWLECARRSMRKN